MVQVTGSGAAWTLTNKEYDGELEPGMVFPLRWDSARLSLSSGQVHRFIAFYSGTSPKINGLIFNGDLDLCDGDLRRGNNTETRAGDTKHNCKMFGSLEDNFKSDTSALESSAAVDIDTPL